jgi:hypothetical protein
MTDEQIDVDDKYIRSLSRAQLQGIFLLTVSTLADSDKPTRITVIGHNLNKELRQASWGNRK